MKTLAKLIVGFLAVVGALTIAALVWLFVADPFGVRSLLLPTPAASNAPGDTTGVSVGQYNLNPAQVLFLEKVGVNPNALPSTISPELELCLTNAVGEKRATEIKAGAVPGPLDLLKAKACFN